MSHQYRVTRRDVVRRTGSVYAAWLIAVAGASQGLAQDFSDFPNSAPGGNSGEPALPSQLQGQNQGQNQGQGRQSESRQGGEVGEGEFNPFSTSNASDASVEVSEYMTVDLHVQDEELANVLQMLSLQSQRNIVVSNNVSATVSANLYDVTFYEALDAILNVNGYGYVERGNFIFVYTLDEIARIEEAQRQPVSRVVTLEYLNANDAAEFVTPLLSEIGQIKTNGDVDAFAIPADAPVGDESYALAATMVLYDYEEHVDEIAKLIEQLDTRPSQVLVEATILQTSLSEANAFGVDFSLIGDVDFVDFLNTGGPLSAANSLISGGSGASGEGVTPLDNNAVGAVSSPGNTSGPGTFKLGVIQDDFSVFLRLLDQVTDVTILSNPKILTLNRQPSRVLVGRRVGYLNTTSTETSTTQSVEFLDTGTQLSFRPFVSKDGMIRMELRPSVSEGIIREATDATGSSVTIPDEVTQELNTNVIVRDGHTIVLGGLFKETTTLARRQVPIVGDIPIIGAAFRGHEDETDRQEIIFMITPTIMNDASLLDMGERAMADLERVRAGTRNGLLPFSRDRMTAQLNVEAERLAMEGDPRKALWKLSRSLELNPIQPDAVRLREALLNEREIWPSRGILNELLDAELQQRLDEMEPVSLVPDPSGGHFVAVPKDQVDQPGGDLEFALDVNAADGDEADSEFVDIETADADAPNLSAEPRRMVVESEQRDAQIQSADDIELTVTIVPPAMRFITPEEDVKDAGADVADSGADDEFKPIDVEADAPIDEPRPAEFADGFEDEPLSAAAAPSFDEQRLHGPPAPTPGMDQTQAASQPFDFGPFNIDTMLAPGYSSVFPTPLWMEQQWMLHNGLTEAQVAQSQVDGENTDATSDEQAETPASFTSIWRDLFGEDIQEAGQLTDADEDDPDQ